MEADQKVNVANSFAIYGRHRSLLVATSTKEEKDKWLTDLTNAIAATRSDAPSDNSKIQYPSLKSNSECWRCAMQACSGVYKWRFVFVQVRRSVWTSRRTRVERTRRRRSRSNTAPTRPCTCVGTATRASACATTTSQSRCVHCRTDMS